MPKFTEIFSKHGIGAILAAATLDGYRRQVLSDNTEYNQKEVEKSKAKFQKDMHDLTHNDMGDIFWSMLDKYYEFLSTLTPDKIVALFNIIMGTLTLSSFFTVMSIMLSEGIINKIKFLAKYPKILKLLKIRTNINKSISKFYLIMHIILITLTIMGNLFMFFF